MPGSRGPKLTDLSVTLDEMVSEVVEVAYLRGIPIQSDWARINGQAVAAAASLGLITSFAGGLFTRMWRPTVAGVVYLEEKH